jgi:hypothetical protein
MRDTWKCVITLLLIAVTPTFLSVAESGEVVRRKEPQSRAHASDVHRPSGERPTPSQSRLIGEILNDRPRGGLAEREGLRSPQGACYVNLPPTAESQQSARG